MRTFRTRSQEASSVSPSRGDKARKAGAPLWFTSCALNIACRQGSHESLSQQGGGAVTAGDKTHSSF